MPAEKLREYSPGPAALLNAARVVAVGAGFFLLALASLALARTTGNLAAVWLASPLLLVVLLRAPRRMWPAYTVACLIGSMLADTGAGAPSMNAALLGLADVFGVLCAAFLLSRGPRPLSRLVHFEDVVRLLVFGLVAGPAAGAVLGAAVISDGGAAQYFSAALEWFASVSLGTLVVAPLVLSWHSRRIHNQLSRPKGFLEALVLFVISVIVVDLIFQQVELPPLIFSTPLLVWAAVRFRITCVAVIVLAITAGAMSHILSDFGGLVATRQHEAAFQKIQLTQAYLGLLAVPMYLLAAMLNDYDRIRRRLLESEERFRDLADLAGDWFWETDEHHRFCDFSNRFEDATAFGLKAFLGRTRWEMSGGDPHSDAWREHIADLEAHRPFRGFKYRVTNSKGQSRYFVISGKPVFHRDGRFRGYIGAGQEITEAVERDAALRESERRFKDYAAAASDFFWQMDKNLRFTWFSNRFTEVAGIDPGFLIGKTREEAVIPGVDPLAMRKNIDDLNNRRAFRGFVHPRSKPNGSTVWLSISGVPVYDEQGGFQGYRGTGSDVTALIESEKALEEKEANLRAAQRIAKLGSFEHDLRTNVVTWSDQVFEIFGRDPSDHVPDLESVVAQIHPDDRERWLLARDAALESGGVYEMQHRILWPGGEVRVVLMRVNVDHDADGTPVRIAGTTQDITDRVHTEEALRQAQKMEAVGQLTGGLAHDFNNLLTVILGNLRLIGRRTGDEPRLARQVEAAERAAHRGADLTRRLLAFSRRQVLDPEVVDAGELVAGMDELLKRALGESVEVNVRASDGLWPVRVDTGQLENAILNLAINARDAMQGHGRLDIDLDNTLHVTDPEATYIGDGGEFVCIAVRDTGCGMSDEVREHAMEPFFTTKDASKGSGLGLSMVYGFVNQSGGQVEIDSAEGSGTTVRLYLPRAEDQAEPARPAPAVQAPPAAGAARGQTVLVVEDDDAVRETAIAALEELGYCVIDAPDGPSALELVEQRDDIDLLFTDVIMPGGMNGVELANKARRLRPGLRVLFTTGYARNAFAGAELEPGAELLNKPYLADELAEKLGGVLRNRTVA